MFLRQSTDKVRVGCTNSLLQAFRKVSNVPERHYIVAFANRELVVQGLTCHSFGLRNLLGRAVERLRELSDHTLAHEDRLPIFDAACGSHGAHQRQLQLNDVLRSAGCQKVGNDVAESASDVLAELPLRAVGCIFLLHLLPLVARRVFLLVRLQVEACASKNTAVDLRLDLIDLILQLLRKARRDASMRCPTLVRLPITPKELV
mmetsp:Transcript_96569/g.312594  ORF Transcript_96569/g.312594 Transcript_96569/m.312594 type:complete len:204 (-) Transcript_96569:1625-2236(-)